MQSWLDKSAAARRGSPSARHHRCPASPAPGRIGWRLIGHLLALLVAGSSAWAQPARPADKGAAPLRSINVGLVRHAFGAWTARIADGGFDNATGRAIRWFPHDTDSTVIAALSSGRLDIGLVGASVAAAAIARGLDIRIFYVLGASADSECLVIDAGPEFKLGESKSLQGKVIAVPFGSTPHFRLLESLRRWGVSLPTMRIVNLQAGQISGAWQRREIDAAVVSKPLAGQLAVRGQILPLPAAGDHSGLMVLAATAEFVAQHQVFLARFVELTARSEQSLPAGSPAPLEETAEIRSIAIMTGLDPAVVAASLGRYRPPPLAEQATVRWLGGGSEGGLTAHLKAAIDVWRWAGRLSGGAADLTGAIALEPVQMALGYQRPQ